MIGKTRSSLGTPVDVPLILTGSTVFGMALAIFSFLPLHDQASRYLSFVGMSLVYLAGGLPASSRALTALWKERALDIDLLMVVAAVAAAVVGAPFEGAVLLTLFSVSTTLEKRALGRAQNLPVHNPLREHSLFFKQQKCFPYKDLAIPSPFRSLHRKTLYGIIRPDEGRLESALRMRFDSRVNSQLLAPRSVRRWAGCSVHF